MTLAIIAENIGAVHVRVPDDQEVAHVRNIAKENAVQRDDQKAQQERMENVAVTRNPTISARRLLRKNLNETARKKGRMSMKVIS